ncbi:uncharacterized protein LOC129020655 [Pongo pygmaeus]|uniref:uncharacterized protein LOC129020655 n=1 Tax=Pongo pygmaeus TaxID=9600 RepID=UPI00300C1480
MIGVSQGKLLPPNPFWLVLSLVQCSSPTFGVESRLLPQNHHHNQDLECVTPESFFMPLAPCFQSPTAPDVECMPCRLVFFLRAEMSCPKNRAWHVSDNCGGN